MTRDEALKLLCGSSSGVRQWNERRAVGEPMPNLARSDLLRADLREANLNGIDLTGTRLSDANLSGAQLWGADLTYAALPGASLAYAELRHANLAGTDLTRANLYRAQLSHANIRRSNLSRANLHHAVLDRADVSYAVLAGADLSDAILTEAGLTGADLTNASLVRCNLTGASLVGAKLVGTDCSGACIAATTVGESVIACDLSLTVGLEVVIHAAPSRISLDSILTLPADLPEVFLRGCGLRDEEIAYFRSVVGEPIHFYSCFISYSIVDEEFASRLYNDFQAAGIRCWKWDQNARTGRSIWGEIDQAIRVYDKVVLIASGSSLKSPAVNREIERAIQEEDRRIKDKNTSKYDGDIDVLFPVRVDNYVFDVWQHERKADVVKKVIADARNWDKDPKVYAKVRDKLIKDLKPA